MARTPVSKVAKVLERSASKPPVVDRQFILQRDARYRNAAPVKRKRADSTTKLITWFWGRWEKFCKIMHGDDVDYRQKMKDGRVEDYRQYFQYRLASGLIVKAKAIWTEWKIMMCVFQDENGLQMDICTRREMHGLIWEQFVDEYDLEVTANAKPVMSVEDLLVALHHLWAFDCSVFSTERQRVQLALAMIMVANTGTRLGALTLAPYASEGYECLRYEHIRLLIIPNPEEPERNLILMEVTLVYTKGNRQAQKPTKFVFHEREDNLALCPILHFLSLAFADDAFDAPSIRSVEDVYRLKVPGVRNSLHLRWKPGAMDLAVFRRSLRTKEGIVTSSRPLGYHAVNFYLKRLGKSAGFKQKLSGYCLRRGTANAVDGVATDAERNQVLGHTRSEIFLKHYLDELVKADVQSAYLGVPARTALIKAVGRMSLDRDPRVPQSLTAEQKSEIKRDPKLVALAAERADMKRDLLGVYRYIKSAQGTTQHSEFISCERSYYTLEKKLQDAKLSDIRELWFSEIDTKEVEAQLRAGFEGVPCTDGELLAPVAPTHSLEERNRLVIDLFGKFEADDHNGSLCRERRFRATADMTSLNFRRETPRQDHRGHLCSDPTMLDEDGAGLDIFEEEPDTFPLRCPSTICLFCLGNGQLSSMSRVYSFARKDSLSRHVHASHLRYIEADATIVCPHPRCSFDCAGHNGFKSHAAKEHNIWH